MGSFFEKIVRPLLFRLPPETAHEIGVEALKLGAGMLAGKSEPCFADLERFGLNFSSPLGVAAGFDKNGVIVDQLAKLGFGFVEVGTVTLEPQTGNEKPRLFRLPEARGLINRLGFNNQGAEVIASRLSGIQRKCVVGVNIGKNRGVPNEEAVENYLTCFERVQAVADYVAINISSPNTPKLRELQQADLLEELLRALKRRNFELGSKPILVKIAPDLLEAEIEAIVDICLRLSISGIIATNTTVGRQGLRAIDSERFGEGGLSGKPLLRRSNEVISAIFKFSNGKLPIVGVGGIFNAQDAFEKIAAGASLLQAYTGFVYVGPSFAREINEALAKLLDQRGFSNMDELVGSASR